MVGSNEVVGQMLFGHQAVDLVAVGPGMQAQNEVAETSATVHLVALLGGGLVVGMFSVKLQASMAALGTVVTKMLSEMKRKPA